eukprot:g77808.t1
MFCNRFFSALGEKVCVSPHGPIFDTGINTPPIASCRAQAFREKLQVAESQRQNQMLLFATVVVILVALYLAHWVIKPLLQSFSQKPATNYQWQFEDPSLKQAGGTVTLEPFPSIYDPPSKYISLIAPAYNEEARIETFLQETLHYLMGKSAHDPTFTWELVIVDDGSKDRTKHVAMDYVKQYGADKLRVLSLDQNQGKGGAVQQGLQCSS